MDFLSIIQEYGFLAYGLIIFFGGRYGAMYFNLFRKKVHNFLLFATVFGLLAIVVERIFGTFEADDAVRYILTYTVVTSCYENLAALFPFLKSKNEND